jgi:cytochrome c553
MKMNKEKVRELAAKLFTEWGLHILKGESVITEWLEQNQPDEKNMFDWTDGEIEGFAIELVGKDFSNLQEVINNLQSMFKAMRRDFDKAKSKLPLSNEQVYDELYQEYQDVKKELEQLKSQQEVKEVIVGLSDEQVGYLAAYFVSKDYGFFGEIETVIKDWQKSQTFTQPESNTLEVVVGLSEGQVSKFAYEQYGDTDDATELMQDLILWLKTQTFTQPEVKEVVVGLSDEQVDELFNYFPFKATKDEFIEGYQEWAKTQTFAQPEVKEIAVGLSDEQVTAFACYYGLSITEQSKLRCELKKWLKAQTFAQPNTLLEYQLDEARKEINRVESLNANLLKQQFQPDWDDAPEWASWLAQDESGAWIWYETKPTLNGMEWAERNGRVKPVNSVDGWARTLQERPSETEQKQEVAKFEVNLDKLDEGVVSIQYGYITYDKDGNTQWFEVGNPLYRPKPTQQVEVGEVWVRTLVKMK